MHNNFDLRLEFHTQQQPMDSKPSENSVPQNQAPLDIAQWTGAFNTSLLTTRANYVKDRSGELSQLMKTPEFESMLVAAQHLAVKENLSQEEATERLIDVFRKLDYAWKQIVVSRGLNSLIDKG